MRRRLAYVLAPLTVLGLSLLFTNGCKQGEGERCQVDSDCDDSIDICNTGTGLCVPKGQMSVDAVPGPDAPVDAGPPDATPADASVDGMPDA